MKTRFSKPSGDVAQEWDRLLREDAENLRRERAVSASLRQGNLRVTCILCGESLKEAESFPHRGLPYLHCPSCTHFQSARLPSESHRRALDREIPFHSIYKPLDPAAYQSRVERIYRPKLDWILDSALAAGATREGLLRRRWLEIGCGAGFFLKALQQAGASQAAGVDSNAQLVAAANDALGGNRASHSELGIPELVRDFDADVYAAFFVLEHTDALHETLLRLKDKPAGTIFCFAVPVQGLGAVLEGAFDHFYARNLDGAVHTHLFTDKSIERAMAIAGYEPVAQWVFGQDASDFARMLLTRAAGNLPATLLDDLKKNLSGLQDDWQACIDKRFLSDSRHVLAVKR